MTQTALDLARSISVRRATVSQALMYLAGESVRNAEKGKIFGVEYFTPHDLRRTFATHASEMGYSDEVIDAVLNHAKKGVIGVYNRNKYDKEKKDLLTAWENRVHNFLLCENPGKIINLKVMKK